MLDLYDSGKPHKAKNAIKVSNSGGQRIGWNTDPANNRMVITFSNVESWMPDVYELAKDWNKLSR